MLPNFLIVGAPRCGTTTLYKSLKQHPQIFLSPLKEPMFFILEGDYQIYPGPDRPEGPREIADYRSLYSDVRSEKAIGEASPCYLSSTVAPIKIKKYIPDIKMIALLRNPVDRAYSNFIFNRLVGREPLADFSEAVAAEEDRAKNGWFKYWDYMEAGFYGMHIERYLSYFRPHQFRFFLFEDLINTPDTLFRNAFQLLGVDENVQIAKPEKFNSSGIPRSRIVQDFIDKPSIIKAPLKKILSKGMQYRLLTKFTNRNLKKPLLSQEIRNQLLALFREDIVKTQDLINRDLSAWLAL